MAKLRKMFLCKSATGQIVEEITGNNQLGLNFKFPAKG